MKRNTHLIFLILSLVVWILTSRSSEAYASEDPQLDREIEIELEKVEGARSYEIKAKPSQANREEMIFSSNTVLFRKSLSLGSWSLEVRSFDRRGVAGRWEKIGDVLVGFKAPKILEPKSGDTIKAAPGKSAKFTFRWESFHPNAEFMSTIQDVEDNTIIESRKVRGDRFDISLKPGQYKFLLKSSPPDGIPVDGNDPEAISFIVSAGKLDSPLIENLVKTNPKTITWALPNFATESFLKIERLTSRSKKEAGEATKNPVFSEKTAAQTWSVPDDLTPGRYKITITAVAKGFEPSADVSEIFEIKAKKNFKKTEQVKRRLKTNKTVMNYDPVDFIQASVGPVLWNYSFSSTSGQKFSLVSGTITAIDADLTKWFIKSKSGAWGVETRGRQTNIYLFEESTGKLANQRPVTVSDRRLALLLRKRFIIDQMGFDAIFGVGYHTFTYLIQEQLTSLIAPISGRLFELYIGGAMDWQFANRSHLAFDLTFHPVGNSFGISADQTWQHTATIRFLKQAVHDRSFLTLNLENFRSRVTTHSSKFVGQAETISNWYRIGLGLALKL